MQEMKDLSVQLQDYPSVLTKADVCRITGVQKTSVGNWLQSGKLQSFRCKGDYRILKDDLIKFMVSKEYQKRHNKREYQR